MSSIMPVYHVKLPGGSFDSWQLNHLLFSHDLCGRMKAQIPYNGREVQCHYIPRDHAQIPLWIVAFWKSG